MRERDGDLATILKDYVPVATHNEVLDALSALDEENGQLRAQLEGIGAKLGKDMDVDKVLRRVGELEGKLRSRNYQDAWKGVADELGIDEDFREDLFDAIRFDTGKDEPDAKAMGRQAKEWIEAKESRKKYLKAAEGDGDGEGEGEGRTPELTPQSRDEGKAAGRPRLHTEADDSGRGSPPAGIRKFRYRSSDLSDHEWMRTNAVAYAKAAAEGRLERIG